MIVRSNEVVLCYNFSGSARHTGVASTPISTQYITLDDSLACTEGVIGHHPTVVE